MLHKDNYSVFEIVEKIKVLVERNPELKNINVVGELTDLKPHKSGRYWFFNLKEQVLGKTYLLPGVFFPNYYNPQSRKVVSLLKKLYDQQVRNKQVGGFKVRANGFIAIYEGQGKYQLQLQNLEWLNEEGYYRQLFRKIYEKLKTEGLFSEEYKKKLPEYPKNIAVITSLQGAARKDVEITLKKRNKNVNLFLIHSSVQGQNAETDLIRALNLVEQKLDFVDFIIITRGGGSEQDLWAFNSEALARRVFKCSIPVVSAVGHETDRTIIDFVADLSASTPTQAIERTVKTTTELLQEIQTLKNELNFLLSETIAKHKNEITKLGNELKLILNKILNKYRQHIPLAFELNKTIRNIINSKQKEIIYLKQMLGKETVKKINSHKNTILQLESYLNNSFSDYIRKHQNELLLLENNLRTLIKHKLSQEQSRIEKLEIKLKNILPKNVLAQGYTLIEQQGKIVRYKKDFDKTKPFTIIWQDGSITLGNCEEN